jgi:hypothetical protein
VQCTTTMIEWLKSETSLRSSLDLVPRPHSIFAISRWQSLETGSSLALYYLSRCLILVTEFHLGSINPLTLLQIKTNEIRRSIRQRTKKRTAIENRLAVLDGVGI